MNIQLSDHFTYKKLIRFTVPSVIMMIFTSVYGVVDGLFVSNFAGKTDFAAVNLIMPFLMIFGAAGFMIGTGGSALVSKTLGEGKSEKAKQLFSMLVYISAAMGIAFSVVGLIFVRPIAKFLGAEGEMLESCVTYGRFILPALTAFILQNEFQSFLITAEKPQFGLGVTVAAGCTNIVLDALFVAVFRWGIVGAAVATSISQIIGALIPLCFFISSKRSPLRLTKTSFDGKAFVTTCTNGSSELMTNLSMSVVNMLYNFQLMKFAGENGVAAYGVIMYVTFIFIAVFFGYALGTAPLIGYHYGAGNRSELKNLFRKSMIIIFICSVAMTALAEALAYPLSNIFVGYDAELLTLTRRAFALYSMAFLFCGFNIYGSSFFTALNDGLVSAVISFLRTLLFQIASVMLLPMILKIDGIWLSVFAAELFALAVTVTFFVKLRAKYHY